jgi:hypothetical protein
MTLLYPLRDFDVEVSDDMASALNWFCARSKIRGIREITSEDVRAFLRDDQQRPDLAEQFVSDLLLPHPANSRLDAEPHQL